MELAPGLADAHLARAYTLSNLGALRPRHANIFEVARPASIPTCSTRITTTAARRSRPRDIEKSIELWHRGAQRAQATTASGPLLRSRRPCASSGATKKPRPVNRECIPRAERLLELNPQNAPRVVH
jgi:hypothetical protein